MTTPRTAGARCRMMTRLIGFSFLATLAAHAASGGPQSSATALRSELEAANRRAVGALHGRRIEWASLGWIASSGALVEATWHVFWTDGIRVALGSKPASLELVKSIRTPDRPLPDETWTSITNAVRSVHPALQRFDGVRHTMFHVLSDVRFEGIVLRLADREQLAPKFAVGPLYYHEFPLFEILANWPEERTGEGLVDRGLVCVGAGDTPFC